MKKVSHVKTIAYSLFFLFLSFISSMFYKNTNNPLWYTFLNKPWFCPPNWVFAPVWTILYILIGIWFSRNRSLKRKNFLPVFSIHMILNYSWSYIFFYKQYIVLASFWILAMIATLLLSMKIINNKSNYIVVPYLLWSLYAFSLSLYIALYN